MFFSKIDVVEVYYIDWCENEMATESQRSLDGSVLNF